MNERQEGRGPIEVRVVSVPGAPTIGVAIPGNASATVSFSPPASDGASPIMGYTVACAPVLAGSTITATGGSSPVTVSGLLNGTVYTCTVRALNSVGTSLASWPTAEFTPGLPGVLQFATSTLSMAEGQTVQVQVTRTGGTTGPASVIVSTAGGSATSGVDFLPHSGTLTWANGESSTRSIVVAASADSIAEGPENFTATLSGAAGASLGSPSVATVTINDVVTFPPGGALPPGAWSQPTTNPGGTPDATIVRGWIVDTNPANAFEGTMSLRSEAISSAPNGQKAVMELRSYTAAGNFSFARKVGSEAAYDCLRFYIDGVAQNIGGTCSGVGGLGASGNVPYAVVSFPVTAGMHTFRWSYEKDPSEETAPDAAWIDAIALPATGLDPAADSDGDGVPNGVELNEAINPTVKDNDVFAATAKGARLFAMQMYRDFLGREGDAGGIGGWSGAVTAGTWTRRAVIDAFLSSAEFAGNVAPVVRLYFATFLRVPDYGGLVYNAGLVRSGTVTLTQLADFFTTGPEFAATYGALDNTAFVTLLYGNVLGRAPDAGGLAGWVGALNGGATRGEVLRGFSDSPEYQARMANEVFVTMMYAGMLRRTPEAAGFSSWVNWLDAGSGSRELVIDGFFQSAEYRGRFLP